MTWISDPDAWSALAALIALEIVLGVDNVIFISILAGKLPPGDQPRARRYGLLAAGGMRVLFVLGAGWVITLKKELFEFVGVGFSGKDLILLVGGLVLIAKATREIHHKLEGESDHAGAKAAPSLASVLGQVMLLDIVFSIDSVITAVGITHHVPVMVISVVCAVIVMLFASRPIHDFVNRHPSVKMLALAFLLLIGTTLIAEGFGQKIPKGYVYSAMAFSVLVEMLQIAMRRRAEKKVEPVHLFERITEGS